MSANAARPSSPQWLLNLRWAPGWCLQATASNRRHDSGPSSPRHVATGTVTSHFSMPSDKAYDERLRVLPAGQRWFSFDVSMPEARQARAERFGMTLWNFHSKTGTKEFESWAFTRDPATGTYWYRVATAREGATSNNRKSLLDALRIARSMRPRIPMKGILKDMVTRRCAPDFVFDIEDVLSESDGSALWLKLDVPGGNLGTQFREDSLPSMTALASEGSTSSKRRGPLSESDHLAARDAAMRIHFGSGIRSREIEALVVRHGLSKGTAEVLLNNFRCLAIGQAFKAPMQADGVQLFVDAIIGRRGAEAIPQLIKAIEGYAAYAGDQWGAPPADFMRILDRLQGELTESSSLEQIACAIMDAPGRATAMDSSAPSELLREVWVRGPQHAAFRRELIRRWSGACSVHGDRCNDQLRASHIVPWRLDESIRGDVNNGLLLSVPLDCLFDQGLISFDNDGAMLRGRGLSLTTALHFGLTPEMRIGWDHLVSADRTALRENLAKHRALHKTSGF